jgi:Tol biopolymer transport system component
MQCPYCSQTHPDGLRFCPITGKDLTAIPAAAAVARPPVEEKSHCPACGKPAPAGVRFCPHCGAAMPVFSGVAPASPPAPMRPKPSRNWAPWLARLAIVLAAVCLILGAGGGLYWFWINNGSSLAVFAPASPTLSATSTQAPDAPATIPASTPTPVEVTEAPPPPEAIFTAAAETVMAQLTQSNAALAATQSALEAAATAAALTASARVTSTPFPTNTPLPATPGLIAFNSNRDGNNDIYVMNADGSNVTRLTTTNSDDRIPSWSPDGRQIAYQSNTGGDYELLILDLDRPPSRAVTNNSCNDFNPVFSPDGERLAFYSDCDGNREIYTIRVDGSDRQQLTFSGETYNWFPYWSPDGRRIAYSSNQGGKYRIWIMNVNGSNPAPLQNGCVPSWSPDGEWIAFGQYCTDLGALYAMRPDGSDLRVLDTQYNNANPSWSPDGSQIAFQSDRSGNEEIWVMNVDGSNPVQLTFNAGRDSAAVWQPVPAHISALPEGPALPSNQVSVVDGMTLVFIPADNFQMGLSNEQQNRLLALCPGCDPNVLRDQLPQHPVSLDAYFIDQTEITNDQFTQFVQANGYVTTAEQKGSSYVISPGWVDFQYLPGADWRQPIGSNTGSNSLGKAAMTQVSWDDAAAYCSWAGRRLPTEAEWEYAARGSDGRLFPWGNEAPDNRILVYNYNSLGPVTAGSYPAGVSPFGLLDMAGNVWEWVSDYYSETYYQSSPQNNPQGPADGEGHPLRGGSWASEQQSELFNVTTTMRLWNKASIRSNVTGFRCAMNARPY